MRPDESCGVCRGPFIEGQLVLPVPRDNGDPPSWIHAVCPNRRKAEG
jgi:hypothetical protein